MRASLGLPLVVSLVCGCSVLFPIRDEEYQSPTGGLGGDVTSGTGGGAGAGLGGASSGGGTTTGGSSALPTPLHHYPFDVLSSSPEDVSSSPKNGTIITSGSVNASSDTTHEAYYFLLDNAAIEFVPDVIEAGPVTISLWVKPDKPENRCILDQQSHTTNAGFRFMLGSIGGTNIPELRIGGATAFDTVHAKTAAPVGSWTHLAFSVVGSPGEVSVALYVNGKQELAQTTTMVNPFLNLATPLHLGLPAHNKDMASFMGGVDDLRIYGAVLTKEQISAIYLDAE